MTDKINNWYEKLGTKIKSDQKLDKNFKKHHILPNSMICCIGGTGSGKTNALIDYLSRKQEAFYDIIIFSGSTTDEPLYKFLEEKIPELKMFNDINELPSLSEFDDDDKNLERLVIFDDFINLKKPEMKKINEYLTAGRKFGFTVWCMAQSYTAVPKIITRNLHYIIMFKLNDNISITNIIRNHNIHDVNKDKFKELYMDATSEPRQFLMIDMKGGPEKYLRKNFLNFYKTT